jgi:ABC-2 type transport system ATP-binding protein
LHAPRPSAGSPTARAAPAIEVAGLVKRYGDVVAVAGLDLLVERGSCVGLLGPNGAGKSTTVNALVGLLAPDAGTIAVLGRSWDGPASREVRERIGVQLQDTRLFDKLTCFEVLRLFASFYRDARRPEDVLQEVALTEKRAARFDKLSGGQKQRLALGCALVNRPELLFLDEPTTGLDPQARRRVWQIVAEFRAAGGTVLLTTHYMEEAEQLCDRVVIIDHGRSIAEGAPRELIRSLATESLVEIRTAQGAAPIPDAALVALPGVHRVRRDGELTVLHVASAHVAVHALLDELRERGVGLADLHTRRATLEDVFVQLTGRHLRDG